MMKRFLFFCLFNLFISQTQAILTIDTILDIEGTGEESSTSGGRPIAIVPFVEQSGVGNLPVSLSSIIASDLQRTGQFVPVDNLPARPSNASEINFPTWQATSALYLVIGRVIGGGLGEYTVEFELFDVFKGVQLTGLSYTATTNTFRQVAHRIADVIYETLTGQRGVAGTRIAYVTLQRGKRFRDNVYKLFVADADGANPQIMLQSREPVLSPTWSPDGRQIAYVSLEGKQAAVYVQDVRTGRRERVSAQQGLNSAPAWSPDGTKLAVSLSKDGNSEVYVLNLLNRQLTRLTNDPSIDTEPEWSPDGRSVVFTSDRSGRGRPQVYRVPSEGGAAQRLTFEGNYNARPRFSPDGRKLAVLHGEGGNYRIGVLDLDNGQLNILSRTSLDESPSFAPNGNMILYGSGSELSAVSIDGRVHQRLKVDIGEEVREPAWSPFSE